MIRQARLDLRSLLGLADAFRRGLLTASLVFGLPVSASADEPTAPFRDAVAGGNLLFLSGQIGRAPAGSDPLAEGMDVAAAKAMNRIGAVLHAHGRRYSDVVKCTIFLADIRAWGRFNNTYVRYFANDKLPARSALAASGLAHGALVEVECIALLDTAVVKVQ